MPCIQLFIHCPEVAKMQLIQGEWSKLMLDPFLSTMQRAQLTLMALPELFSQTCCNKAPPETHKAFTGSIALLITSKPTLQCKVGGVPL